MQDLCGTYIFFKLKKPTVDEYTCVVNESEKLTWFILKNNLVKSANYNEFYTRTIKMASALLYLSIRILFLCFT